MEAYAGQDTRPLALVNTDNRVIASAARGCWEHILAGEYISTHQQGFLEGTLMINNFVDIDYNAMSVSLLHKRGALLLFISKQRSLRIHTLFEWSRFTALGCPNTLLT